MVSTVSKRILLTGATGFVGRAVAKRLVAAGWYVRCLTRQHPAQRDSPSVEWMQGDLSRADDCARCLDGCEAAIYLVHSLGEGANLQQREVASAAGFATAAARAGVGRILYLGGIAPAGGASEHLRSRLAVGETLRNGSVPAIELRASMIIGQGSLSWVIVRDLAARLPVMILPSWLRSRTQPVAIDDVVIALVAAAGMPVEE